MFTVEVARHKFKQKTDIIKADGDLFRRLLVAMEAGREIDVDKLLMQELCSMSLALATNDGCLRPANKAQLLSLLGEDVSHTNLPKSQASTCIIMDGMTMVQALGKPKGAETFGDYASIFSVAINANFRDLHNRVDVVFDSYKDISIKEAARQRRTGKTGSIRREISSRDLKLPVQRKPFIDLIDDKESLAVFRKNELWDKAPVGDRELVVSGCNDGTAASSVGRNVAHLNSSQEAG